MTGDKARPKTEFHFNVQERSVPESSGASLAKRPCLESRTESCQKVAESLLVVVSLPVNLTLGGRGAMGVAFLMHYSPQPHHHLLLLLCRLVHVPSFQISGEALLPTGLCLI